MGIGDTPAESLHGKTAIPPALSVLRSPKLYKSNVKCRCRAVRAAGASGFALLPISLCTLMASVGRYPPKRWPRLDQIVLEVGCPLNHVAAAQILKGPLLCCHNMAPRRSALEQSLRSRRSDQAAPRLSPGRR